MDPNKVKEWHRQKLHEGILKWNKEEYKKWRARVIEEEGEKRDGVAYISPSSASIMIPDNRVELDRLEGSCRRAVWLSKMDFEPSDPIPPANLRKMAMGKVIEGLEHKFADSAGLTVVHNLRINHPITPTCILQGEIDSCLQMDDGTKYILEIKSFYGYQAAKKIFGNRSIKGKPKISHLMQVLLYLSILEEKDPAIKFSMLHYIDRSNAREGSFVVGIEKKKEDGKVVDAWPVIDGATYHDVSLREIYKRHMELAKYILEEEMPPRDADPKWEDDTIIKLHKAGEISKYAFTDWQNGKRIIRDWQCDYCQYRTLCLGNALSSATAELPSDGEVLSNACRAGGRKRDNEKSN